VIWIYHWYSNLLGMKWVRGWQPDDMCTREEVIGGLKGVCVCVTDRLFVCMSKCM
jgi:hypothetical protein